MIESQLPQEFAPLVSRVQYVQRKNDNEYSSSCPQCGGDIHSDGSWPDRFVLWRSNKHGEPFAMCLRGHCGFKWSIKKQDAQWTVEEREEFTRKRIELEAAYNAQIETRLAELSAKIMEQAYFEKYHNQAMNDQKVVDYFESRGIPEAWQRHLMTGCIYDYRVTGKLSVYESIAFTIPIWSETGRIENIKLRIGSPKHDNDRYRNFYKSGCQHLYNPQYKTTTKAKHAILMEGEFKADVGVIYGGLNTVEYRIYGVQSKQPEERLLKKLSDYDAVYLAFDPDAYRRTQYTDQKTGEIRDGQVAVMEVARQVGFDRARLVIPPRDSKFDDAILAGYSFANAVRMAIKPEKLR